MLGSELRNVATSPGPIGSRIKIKQIVNRSTSIKTPLLPSVNIKKKDFAEDQDDATTQSKSYQFGSKKRERKLFTKSRKKWKNVSRRFSSPFGKMLRNKRKNANLKGTRGTLLLFDTNTKNRITLTEAIECRGFNVEQHSIAESGIAALRKNHQIAGAIVAINSKQLQDSSLEFLHLLDTATDRLVDIAVALLPSVDDIDVMKAMKKDGKSSNCDDLIHLRRGMSIPLRNARLFRHVRIQLNRPNVENKNEVECILKRFEEMTEREKKASNEFKKANSYDFKHKKEYLKMLETRKYSSGHRALHRFVDRSRQLQKIYMANWKKYTEVNKKKLNGQVSNLKKSSALKQGMLRGRKQGLFKLLKTKARSVSAAKRVWQRSVAANITHDRLIKTTILPSWLPLNMRKLYLAPDTSTRDLERAIEIFDRMVLRRSEVWPRACRAMAYCLLSEKSSCEATSQKYLKLAEKELTICLQKKLEKDRGDLLYNRSVVRLRQGHIDTSIQDLNEVIQLYNRDNRNLENKFLLATLHNRSFVQRRFGNFVRSFADLTMLHNTKQEHENNKNNTQINRRNSCSNNGNDDAHKIWHHNDETIVQRSSFNGIRSGLPNDSPSTSPLQETNSSQMPSFSLVDNALHPMLASSSFDPQPETMEQSVEDGLPLSLSSKYVSGVPSDSSSDSSSNSSSDSYSDSSSDEAESGSFHSTNLVQHRRNSMIGNLGSIHKEALLGSTTKNNIHTNDSPVDHTDTHLHALEILQNFSDSQLEKKLDSEKQNTDQKIVHTHSAIEIVMMNEKQKNKAIEDGLKHMFNKTLPTNVYDALHVPVELRTRKHWKSIRFVTDTMKAFADYPEMLKNYLVKVLTLSDSTVDTYICREGDPADNFYVVVAGYLRVEVKHPNDKTATIVVNRMGPGASFGELSLVFDQNRAASVISDAKHVSLLVIPKTQFHDLGLAQYHLALLQEKYATLCCNRLFDSWSDEALTALAQIAQVKTFQQHTKILKQDSRPDYFHILRKGVVDVLASSDAVGELKSEERDLCYKLDRSRKKFTVSKLLRADDHVREKNREEAIMQNRLLVVKKQIKRCMLLPKPKVQTKIATLFAPAFFGEGAVCSPNRGEPYTVVAATSLVETLQIARPQIKSKWIKSEWIDALKRGMVRIPNGEQLRMMKKVRAEWSGKRSEICKMIDTSRHPNNILE